MREGKDGGVIGALESAAAGHFRDGPRWGVMREPRRWLMTLTAVCETKTDHGRSAGRLEEVIEGAGRILLPNRDRRWIVGGLRSDRLKWRRPDRPKGLPPADKKIDRKYLPGLRFILTLRPRIESSY